jgi:hypothetical protein
MKRLLGVAIASVLLGSCADLFGPGNGELAVLRRRLERAEQRWEAEGPGSYTITLRRLCYCLEVEPRQVTVTNGVVTDVRIEGADAPLPAEQWQWYPSVPALFDIIREAIELPAHSLDPEFHDTLGYALRVAIDWDAKVADEEVTYEVTSFVWH